MHRGRGISVIVLTLIAKYRKQREPTAGNYRPSPDRLPLVSIEFNGNYKNS